jgi:hypothetical protein
MPTPHVTPPPISINRWFIITTVHHPSILDGHFLLRIVIYNSLTLIHFVISSLTRVAGRYKGYSSFSQEFPLFNTIKLKHKLSKKRVTHTDYARTFIN